jgi:hypothetical protein
METAKRFQNNVSINTLHNVFLHQVALSDADTDSILGSGFTVKATRVLALSIGRCPVDRQK